MSKSIKLFNLIILFIFLSTYTPNNQNNHKSLLFPIKKIKITNHNIINPAEIIEVLSNIKGSSLFFLNHNNIKAGVANFEFIESFELKKIYPDTLKIIIFEKTPIVIYYNGKKNFYLSEKNELIKFREIDKFKNLPLLIGKKKNFNDFYNNLKLINFPIDKIKSFNYFNIGRWDIILKNKIIVKLPDKNYIEPLENFIVIMKNKDFDKYKIFDYRISNQLILN